MKKEGLLWGGAVVIALTGLLVWYGWVDSQTPSAPDASLAPAGQSAGGDD